MTAGHTSGGPGWSLPRVAALFVLGIAAGAAVGVTLGLGILAAEAIAGSDADSAAYLPIVVWVGGGAGAVVATLAGIGALAGLLVLDHWGERGPWARAAIAGFGAAVAVGAVGGGASLLDGGSPGASVLVPLGLLAIAAGLLAALGLLVFERRMRVRDA